MLVGSGTAAQREDERSPDAGCQAAPPRESGALRPGIRTTHEGRPNSHEDARSERLRRKRVVFAHEQRGAHAIPAQRRLAIRWTNRSTSREMGPSLRCHGRQGEPPTGREATVLTGRLGPRSFNFVGTGPVARTQTFTVTGRATPVAR